MQKAKPEIENFIKVLLECRKLELQDYDNDYGPEQKWIELLHDTDQSIQHLMDHRLYIRESKEILRVVNHLASCLHFPLQQPDTIKQLIQQKEYLLSIYYERWNAANSLISDYTRFKIELECDLYKDLFDLNVEPIDLSIDRINEMKKAIFKLNEEQNKRISQLQTVVSEAKNRYSKIKNYLPEGLKARLGQLKYFKRVITSPYKVDFPILTQERIMNELSELSKDIDNEYSSITSEIIKLTDEITSYWKELGIADQALNVDYENLGQYKQLRDELDSQWQMKMRDRISSLLHETEELWEKCSSPKEHQERIVNQITPYTLNSVTILETELQAMQSRYKSTKKIIDLVHKRADLLNRIKQFEITASDPKRLFQPSFQLLEEEKFRKTCFPSLLKLEGELKISIELYQQNGNEFRYKDFTLHTLNQEIAMRFINTSVFVMKSPRKSLSMENLSPRKSISMENLKKYTPKKL
ncbi:carboxypeptidase C prc1 [Boothiomyces sp. JEL0866]|nr:carboxypeptidase C prc1 [Boothiomyces sp. JEL0866]